MVRNPDENAQHPTYEPLGLASDELFAIPAHPHGAGPRSCIGDHFAMLEATFALATIIRCTEIESSDPEFPMIVPFTTVADAPIRARVNDTSHA